MARAEAGFRGNDAAAQPNCYKQVSRTVSCCHLTAKIGQMTALATRTRGYIVSDIKGAIKELYDLPISSNPTPEQVFLTAERVQ